jgi:anti-sigma28 factor (negative regulator of flagellin synthesis)
MEIRNDSSSDGAAKRIDITKTNREAIRRLNPSPASPDKLAADDSASNNAKRIADARAEASVHKRVKDARAEASVLKRVADARAEASVLKRVKGARAEASVEKRVQAARKDFANPAPEDQVTLSSSAKELSDTQISPRASDADTAARTKRVEELKAQYQGGQLDVGSLVAEAAYRMLGGE